MSACATSPDEIAPAYVSPIQYARFDCDQIRREMERISLRASQVAGQQRKTRNQDTAAVAVNVVIFWPAIFLIGNDDNQEELAHLGASKKPSTGSPPRGSAPWRKRSPRHRRAGRPRPPPTPRPAARAGRGPRRCGP